LKDLEKKLAAYVDNSFSEQFFNRYIYGSDMPDYKSLLASVGIDFSLQYEDGPYFGATLENKNNKWLIGSNPQQNSSLYIAGFSKGDEIISIDGKLTNNKIKPNEFLKAYKVGETVKVVYNRFENQHEAEITFVRDPAFKTALMEETSKEIQQRQNAWLKN
ncbi:PDZ domain-containing protein, partial [Lutimonas sp.]|uniref:PDZ domain-containing protein n=1 Tax=Lutimonas sp. TaxID=1872403 RepID=UPI003C723FEC